MAEITKEVLKLLPPDSIDAVLFEGATIVLYAKDKDFFVDNRGGIRKAVSELKKRIELRCSPKLLLEEKKAEKEIKNIIPEEAKISQILFEEQRSIVTIEAEKPGLAIGKQGALLKEIRQKTCWVPIVKRTPPLQSKLIEDIRHVLYKNSEFRRKFLNDVGHRTYDGWKREKQKEWIRVTFLGSGRQAGRNCLFLQTPESRILLDCGINVAGTENDEAYPYLNAPEFKISELDAVIITSAHLDHCGFLPYLFKYGYAGPVYCTAPTRDIMSLLLLDLVKITKAENKAALYSIDDIKTTVKHTITLNYEEVTDITPDIRVTFYNAGHILGSSMAHMHIGNGLHNFLYTGGMKYGKSQLLGPAVTNFPRLETVALESTYGGKSNIFPPAQEQDKYLKNLIKEAVTEGGKVLMPVLGSGRAQDIMIMIESMVRKKEIEPIPVYIDGMVWDITAIHTAYPEFLNNSISKVILHKDHNPFLSDIFRHVDGSKERSAIARDKKPCIVLATSGMLVGGPALEYLRHFANSTKNTLIFSCYQPYGSLGQRIQRGEVRDITYKEGGITKVVPLKMKVDKVEITDHSDRKQLMNFIFKCSPRPKKVIIHNGEVSRSLDLASSLHKQGRIETVAPKNLETVRL